MELAGWVMMVWLAATPATGETAPAGEGQSVTALIDPLSHPSFSSTLPFEVSLFIHKPLLAPKCSCDYGHKNPSR